MTASPNTILRNLFGDNRAEWPPAKFRELFVEPTYFSKLESLRPSLLVGGRGTGKTTSLRSLRYDATLDRLEADGRTFGDQTYLGIFVRVNKNRAHAFRGDSLNDSHWDKAIAHYFNILVCSEMVKLTTWLEQRTGKVLSRESLDDIGAEFRFPQTTDLMELNRQLKRSLSELQLYVNNASTYADRSQERDLPVFSIAEAPLRTFAEALQRDGLTQERTIFCCIDEYENLLPNHQAIFNTYIKHAEPPLSYKVGVRGGNGLRTWQTIDGRDLLRNPDDYEHIEIAQEGFEYFAKAVAELRLTRAKDLGVAVSTDANDFMQKMSLAEEAVELGAKRIAANVLKELKEYNDLHDFFAAKPPEETYFLRYWAESERMPLVELARDWQTSDGSTWKNRLNNYGYASLFWLSKGRKGARIRKYYCGARTITSLAGGNIRYFLELLDMSIAEELTSKDDNWDRMLQLSPKSQTLAARSIGPRRLKQLEDLADHGVELKRLALAIGKTFFELARHPLGSTPEVTSFILGGDKSSILEIEQLLMEGVAHLAFEACPRTKATTATEVKDNEYRLHPIYCAFFEISHRRKRRLTFDATVLLDALSNPSKGISALLDGEAQTPESELPDQLAFFSSFYHGGGASDDN